MFIISAPSGSGKSTLVGELMKRDPGPVFLRFLHDPPARGRERDGSEYHFITRDEFEQRLANDEFLEWAEVFGNYYGTHRQ